MAVRPVFVAESGGPKWVRSVDVEFKWHSGLAATQKAKSRDSLHAAARHLGLHNLLEVSSRSGHELGRQLSAFRLKVEVEGTGHITVESVFQGSKVFAGFGPCHDLYSVEPQVAKRLARERDRGDLIEFRLMGETWELVPRTAFYDWVYLQGLSNQTTSVLGQLEEYDAFTDIEFNPEKSFNCQAHSCALAVALMRRGSSSRL